MDTTAVIVIVLIVILMLAKLYNGYNTVSKKGVTGLITQKLTMLAVVTVVLGIVMLINPDLQIQDIKETITSYVSTVIQ